MPDLAPDCARKMLYMRYVGCMPASALLALFACSPSMDSGTAVIDSGWSPGGTGATQTGTSDSGGVTDSADTTDTTDTTEAGDTQDTGEPLGFVSGTVVDEGGAPLEGILVTLCRGACVADNTDEEGWFLLPDIEPENYPFSFVDLAGEHGVGIPLFMLPVAPGEDIVLSEPVVMPKLQPSAVMPESLGDVTVVDGVTLTVDPAELWLAPWEPDNVLQAAVPAEIPALVPYADTLGVWYLAPFKSISYTPMPLTLDNRWGLAPGDTARAWYVSYLDAEWVDAGQMTVSPDGSVLTGAAISELTTLVLARDE
jgi:hypothetical protein